MSKAGPSPRTPAFSLEPVTYGRANRQLILEKSMSVSGSQYNQHIRRSLGFRETGAYGKGVPVFASKNVDRLYSELDQLAKTKLPHISQEALCRAWQDQTYTKDVKCLVEKHGERIWGDSLEDRKLSSNPKSQLLTAEDGSEAGDLFYKYGRHREFIALQLEHLLFMKAKAIYHNYYARSAHSAVAEHKVVSTWSGSTRARNSQPSSSVVATPGRKLVVTLSLPPDKLRTIFFRTSSHIAQKRARDGAGRFLPGAMFGGSDDCESDDEWTLSKRRRASQRYRRSNANHDTEYDDSSATEKASEHSRGSAATANKGPEAMAERSASEKAGDVMRMNLRNLLYRELRLDNEDSHTKLPKADSMIEKSKRLDNIILTLQKRAGDEIRTSLGESFEQDVETLNAWLSWRAGCWLLSEATGMHPLGGQPTPRLTVEEWRQKLGGEDKLIDFHQTLTNYGQIAGKIHDGKEETTRKTADSLARIFAVIAKSPFLEYGLRKHIMVYNELLSSWQLDLWM